MAKIVKQYTRALFPFAFNKKGIAVEQAKIKNKKNEDVFVFETFSQSCESLRDGLDSMLSVDGGTAKIADCYTLNINCRKLFDLPPRKTEYLDFISRQTNSTPKKVSITDVKFYLFESDVGFVELEFEYESSDIEDYVNLNYFTSEIKNDKNHFIYHEKVWNEQSRATEVQDKEFTVGMLLEKVFKAIAVNSDVITRIYKKSKPITYSYMLLDEAPEDAKDLLRNLSKNYKDSYKYDDTCSDSKILHPFENSYWTASLNGATNLSYLTGDSITDEFFTNNFYSKTKDTYYFLFLNVLHQRYAIMRIMGEMGTLDRLSNDYVVMEKELRMARRLEAKAINLNFRAFFKYPSSIDHVNQYYDMLYEAMQVDLIYNSFTTDINNLQNICNKYVERIQNRDERLKMRREVKIEIFIALFGVVLAEISVFNDSWALVERVLGHPLEFWSAPILIMIGALMTPIITITLDIKKKIVEIKRLSKLLDVEKEDGLVEDDKTRQKNVKEDDIKRRKSSKNKEQNK